MLSLDCQGCQHMRECARRFILARVGDKVYCPDGTAHLIDSASLEVANP